MSLMNSTMDIMIKSIKKEKREEMMINMMPLMMEGIDMNELMPKLMTGMLKEVTVDDVFDFLKEFLKDREKFQELSDKIKEADLVQNMMFKTYKSTLSFDDTLFTIKENAPRNGWHIPDTRDLQKLYQESGLSDMTRVTIMYFCDPEGGYSILRDDRHKAMSVMMPMGVSVYETSEGEVEIAAMNIGMMSGMFSGITQEVFRDSAKNLEKTLEDILAFSHE